MESISEFNEIQRSVVNWNDGQLLVVGGAGTGENKILSHLIARIIKGPPNTRNKVLVLANSNSSLAKLRNRIYQLIPNDKNKVRLETFLSLTEKMLRSHGSKIGLKSDFNILDDEFDRQLLLDKAIENVEAITKTNLESLGLTSKKLLPLITVITERNVAHNQIGGLIRNWLPSNHEIVTQICLHFRRLMFVTMNFDYPSLFSESLALVTVNRFVRELYSGYNPYICVDDFQRLTHSQFLFIKQLMSTGKSKLIVTTNDEQIFDQWNSDIVDRLVELQKLIGLNVRKLPKSHNCPVDIAQIGCKLVSSAFQKTIESENDTSQIVMKPPTNVQFHQFEDSLSEFRWVASEISAMDIESRKKCVIIAKSKRLLEQVQMSLTERGIECCLPFGKTKFESPHMAWFESVLRLAISKISTDHLHRICKNFHTLCGININVEDITSYAILEDEDYLQSWAKAVLRSEDAHPNVCDLLENSLIPDLIERQDFLKFKDSAFQWLDELAITKLHTNNVLEDYDNEIEVWNNLISNFSNENEGQVNSLYHLVEVLNEQRQYTYPSLEAVHCVLLRDFYGHGFENIFIIGMAEIADPLSSSCSTENSRNYYAKFEERMNLSTVITLTEKTLTLTCSKTMSGRLYKPSKLLQDMGLLGEQTDVVS